MQEKPKIVQEKVMAIIGLVFFIFYLPKEIEKNQLYRRSPGIVIPGIVIPGIVIPGKYFNQMKQDSEGLLYVIYRLYVY